jgi:hypothetical protein
VIHPKATRDLPLEAVLQAFPLALGNRVEDHPHEEATLVARVLIGIDDVEPSAGEEAADCRDQSGLVRAGKEQPRCRFLSDGPIIPPIARTASNYLPAGLEI